MSQLIDYTYRFEGAKGELALAIEAINKIKEDNKEYSGKGDCDYDSDLGVHPDHMEWYFYTTDYDLVEAFNKKLKKLSKDSSLVVYVHWSTSDGQWASGIGKLEKGKANGIESWDAAIDMDTQLAILRYRESPSLDDLKILCSAFEFGASDYESDDDDEDEESDDDCDWSMLFTATEIAREIFGGLVRDSTLAAIPSVKKLLKKSKESLKNVRHLLDVSGEGTEEQFHDIDGLLAIINAHEIAKVMEPPKPPKKKKSGFDAGSL